MIVLGKRRSGKTRQKDSNTRPEPSREGKLGSPPPQKCELILGDCLEKIKGMSDNSVNLVLTDPPFNIGKDYGLVSDKKEDYYNWCYSWLDDCCRVMKPTGSFYVMNYPKHLAFFYVHLIKRGMLYKNWISWVRNDNQFYDKQHQFKPNHQDILRFTKSEDFFFNWQGASKRAIWDRDKRVKGLVGCSDTWQDITYVKGNSKEKSEHPCPWPLKLVERIIKTSSREGDLILDPFMGSGTTGVAALKLNRKFIGIEINPDYFKIAKERIREWENQTRLVK